VASSIRRRARTLRRELVNAAVLVKQAPRRVGPRCHTEKQDVAAATRQAWTAFAVLRQVSKSAEPDEWPRRAALDDSAYTDRRDEPAHAVRLFALDVADHRHRRLLRYLAQ